MSRVSKNLVGRLAYSDEGPVFNKTIEEDFIFLLRSVKLLLPERDSSCIHNLWVCTRFCIPPNNVLRCYREISVSAKWYRTAGGRIFNHNHTKL